MSIAPFEPPKVDLPPLVKVDSLLARQPDVTLEFRRRVKKPDRLADIIGGFANTNGGYLVLGYDYKQKKTVKMKRSSVESLFFKASKLLPQQIARLDFLAVNAHEVAVISIGRTDELVASPGGIFERSGASHNWMSKERIRQIVFDGRGKRTVPHLMSEIADLKYLVSETKKRNAELLSWKTTLKDKAIGAIIGVAVTWAIGQFVSQVGAFFRR